ncbi:MAG: rubrerythrin family protein [Finegoldia sp.]|nr:rubrerythrin family protein [Finegoldia sp.]
MDLKGSKTASNLITAFAGECQAAQRYTLGAKAADKEGFKHIKAVFLETADNERTHANTYYKYLRGEEFQLEAIELDAKYGKAFPVVYSDTKTALKGAIDGENEEATDMYPEYEKIAREEGFDDIADTFKEISEVEAHHRDRYQTLLDTLEADKMFKKDETTIWKCLNCGYIHEGDTAPEVCPACKHPQGWFMDTNLVK